MEAGVPLNTALSGLKASSKQIAVSANNVANVQSTTSFNEVGEIVNEPFVPQQVILTSEQTGGVIADVRPVENPTLPALDPDNPAADENGFIQVPNVDLAEEVANQIRAESMYRFNIQVIQATEEIQDSLIDILQ